MTDRLLVKVLFEEFELLRLIWCNGQNAEVNAGEHKCIADYGAGLERVIDRPVGHGEISGRCKRLVSHGFVVTQPGRGGRKLLALSPECERIFKCFGEMERGQK